MIYSFKCMSHLFMGFRHFRVYSWKPCFFRIYGTHTSSSVSPKMMKWSKRGLPKQWEGSEFSPQTKSALFWSRNVIIILFTAKTSNESKKRYRTHCNKSGYRTHNIIQKYLSNHKFSSLPFFCCTFRSMDPVLCRVCGQAFILVTEAHYGSTSYITPNRVCTRAATKPSSLRVHWSATNVISTQRLALTCVMCVVRVSLYKQI